MRLSDARMSGTAFGTIVLHITPEVRDRRPAGAGAHRRPDPAGRRGRRIDLLVDEAEIGGAPRGLASAIAAGRCRARLCQAVPRRSCKPTRAAISTS